MDKVPMGKLRNMVARGRDDILCPFIDDNLRKRILDVGYEFCSTGALCNVIIMYIHKTLVTESIDTNNVDNSSRFAGNYGKVRSTGKECNLIKFILRRCRKDTKYCSLL